ncbi:MAG TPA: T9SS type A sorting domain-containing protein, partial [Flavobacteriales bacterium]|nr:T9SS type A sorting domain-containing protein [Flavobacteriales bacterium]
TVVVTASRRTATSSAVTVTVGTPPTASISAANSTTICEGGSVTLNANTGTGLTYQWRRNGSTITGATASSYVATLSGTYTVVVTSNGCSTTSAGRIVTVNGAPMVSCSVSGSTITTTVSGGTSPYTYSWSSGGTSNSFTATSSGTYTVTVTGANGCSTTCTSTVTIASAGACTGIRTEAQGTWGATATSNNPAAYMTTRFAAAFPAPNYLTLGCGTRLLRFTTPAAVIASLPTYGTPAVLASGTVTNPGTSIANTMVGQLTALKLNVRFDELDAAFMPSTVLLRNMIITSGPFAGWTVQQLITAADQAIGGCSTAFSLSQLSTALASVNNGYDGGVANSGFLTCPGSGMAEEGLSAEPGDTKLLDLPGMEVLAMPNPFSTATELVLTGVAGDASTTIEIYSATGQRITVLFSGVLDAAEEHRFRWDATGQAQAMYLYRVTSGEQVLTGRLLLQ